MFYGDLVQISRAAAWSIAGPWKLLVLNILEYIAPNCYLRFTCFHRRYMSGKQRPIINWQYVAILLKCGNQRKCFVIILLLWHSAKSDAISFPFALCGAKCIYHLENTEFFIFFWMEKWSRCCLTTDAGPRVSVILYRFKYRMSWLISCIMFLGLNQQSQKIGLIVCLFFISLL